ncbi:MAG: hypothetical protein IJS50_03325, partial [Desulfovibrio sp.]|nr:hypothetical protein [Desulfovibrio sp.]
ATVTSRGSQEPGLKALEQGLEIRKLGLLAKIYEDGQTEEDEAVVCRFQLDDTLAITGLKMPKGEKGGDKAGDFILKADHAFLVVELVEKLFIKKDD